MIEAYIILSLIALTLMGIVILWADSQGEDTEAEVRKLLEKWEYWNESSRH
jgi:hypothetical protein